MTDHSTLTRPPGTESAPYFAALVATSCTVMPKASTWRGGKDTSGPCRVMWSGPVR